MHCIIEAMIGRQPDVSLAAPDIGPDVPEVRTQKGALITVLMGLGTLTQATNCHASKRVALPTVALRCIEQSLHKLPI